MRTIIAFDISNDRVRQRVARLLLDHLDRVQKSVFETSDLSRAALLRLRSRVERLLNPETDSMRYYRLCRACGGRIEHYGVGPGELRAPDDVEVI